MDFRELSTQMKGTASELAVKYSFLSKGFTVLTPESVEPYDLVVINEDGDFLKIQVKTANPAGNGSIQCQTQTVQPRTDGYQRTSFDKSCDYFAFHWPEEDEIYIVDTEEAPQRNMRIRYEKAGNGQTSNIHWHEDYHIDNRIDEL